MMNYTPIEFAEWERWAKKHNEVGKMLAFVRQPNFDHDLVMRFSGELWDPDSFWALMSEYLHRVNGISVGNYVIDHTDMGGTVYCQLLTQSDKLVVSLSLTSQLCIDVCDFINTHKNNREAYTYADLHKYLHK